MAGDGTAIGDGLGLALKRLRDVEGASKAVILMTDGVNTAGRVSPLKAAAVAKELGIQVNTIGIGTRSAPIGGVGMGGLLPVPGNMMADFDEKTLKEIAQMTGGAYFNASSLEGFQDVYRKIEKLQETESQQPEQRLVQELFPLFAVAGLFSFLIGTLLKSTVFMRVP
jgi:Ca-activated chloride channel family protein